MRKTLIRNLHLYQKWRRGARIKALHPKDVVLMLETASEYLENLVTNK